MKTKLFMASILGLSAVTAEAALESRPGGMVYDTDRDITWAADANLFQTQAAGNPNLVTEIIDANGGVIVNTPNIYDTPPNSGQYTLTAADFNTSTGALSWFGAQAWANSLTLGGFSDWRLPTTNPTVAAYNETGSELGHLFYTELGGIAGQSITTTHNDNYNLFSNVQDPNYWSGTESSFSNLSWFFWTENGYQNFTNKKNGLYAWAVRSGDVAAVPVPGAVWLFGSGLVGLLGLKRRGNIG